MSTYLWKYYFEDDVEKFREVLANATYSTSASAAKSGYAGRGGTTNALASPGSSLSKSPNLSTKSKKVNAGHEDRNATFTRADLNWRDAQGVTLLHYIASSAKKTASRFALALLEVSILDLYVQDAESGWTSLHRALYTGNIAIARMLMSRDAQDTIGQSHGGTQHSVGGLIKIKDHEGKSPFDVYAASITNRIIHSASNIPLLSGSPEEDDNEMAQGVSGDSNDDEPRSKVLIPCISVEGDDVFAFGSNKNFTLGFGDEDDRQYPERITLKRSDYLLARLHAEHQRLQDNTEPDSPASPSRENPSALPAVVQYRAINIQDIQLSKLHSAILTTDPEANLYMCGFGSGGRLGTGDETTRFHYVPICGGGLLGKRVIYIGLGQNHTLAITRHGEVFTWGSNTFGQLGYASAAPRFLEEEPLQLLPRQVFGPLKRELVLGAAASRVHSVVHTSNSLFTFGKNDGQLGLVDSDARSLAIQNTPRKVAASLFTSAITAVSAIDKATVCLLENHDVWVFANYGYTRMIFPLETFSNYFLKSSYAATKYNNAQNYVCKITSGGDTICALSSMGDVFTVHVSQSVETGMPTASTTNPSKIRGALSSPQRVWSMNRGQMAVKDVDVGQDGSIIICTDSGSVWRRVKRAKIKDANVLERAAHKSKDYKFSRVPGLTRITAVRSNTFGGYAAVRKDCDVMKSQMGVDNSTLWKDMFPLLPLKGFASKEDPTTEQPAPRFWTSAPPINDTASVHRAILGTPNLEQSLSPLLRDLESSDTLNYDLRIGSTVAELVLPIHEFVLAGRSRIASRALADFRQSYFFSIPDVLSIEYDSDGKVLIQLRSADILTVINVVLYIYTDSIVEVWHHTRHAPKLASRYRQVRVELMKIAAALGMKKLEQAVRLMVEPPKTLDNDFSKAMRHPEYFDNGDVEVELDGKSIKVHRAMICQRCPFFEGLFNGRAGGAWLFSRREQLQEPQETVKVDLKHINPSIFQLVLQYIYTDDDHSIFDDVVTTDFDAFLDLIIDVMAVANELMLDRLAQCCQKMLGHFVHTRNVCQLLNAVAPCSVTEFKNTALEYICLNLEGMLENCLLDELDDDLMLELDEIVRQNQLACLPFAKSGRAEAELFDSHPELMDIIERGKRAKIDSFHLQSRLRDEEQFFTNAAKARSLPQYGVGTSLSPPKARRKSFNERDDGSNLLKQRTSAADLMFEMEEDPEEALGKESLPGISSAGKNRLHSSPRIEGSSPCILAQDSAHGERADDLPLDLDSGVLGSPTLGISSQYSRPGTSAEDAVGLSRRWASSTFDSPKLNMKDIMAQASSSKHSGLSTGLALRPRNVESTTSSPMTKLSQRERKRQQQQGQVKEQEHPSPSTPPEQPERAVQPASPWRVSSVTPRVSLKEVLGNGSGNSPTVSTEKERRQASGPPLTLRQTVSGTVPAVRRTPSGGPQQQHATPKPTHSILTPVTAAKLSSSPLVRTENDSPSIRSIHYGPPPAEPSLQLSMADIVSQQQTEKDVIKEAVAKRSLQEIQEEQAFQEWWDQESRKVQEEVEEEASRGKTVGPRGGKSGAGRGRSKGAKGRGRGRGGGDSSDPNISRNEPSNPSAGLERRKHPRVRGDAERGHDKGTRTLTN